VGKEGRKSRTGRGSRDRTSGRSSIDTLKANEQDHMQGLFEKVKSGGDVKASPRWLEKNPRE
jgi:hypothetical protein